MSTSCYPIHSGRPRPWTRAIRRGAWAGLFVTVLVLLRLEGVLVLPIVLFMLALIAVAEVTLSAER